MNFTPVTPEVFLKSSSNNSKSVFYKCNLCKKKVDLSELKNHAEQHDPAFKLVKWQTILNLYSLDF